MIQDVRGLDQLATELAAKAADHHSGRAAETVYGGHERSLRQTMIALVADAGLAEHESPGDATLLVLAGQVRLSAGEYSWEGARGDLLVIPPVRHDLAALTDAVVLLSVAKDVGPAS